MTDVRLLTGGEAVAHAMRQVDPDVVPVYPITPQTPIIQTFAKLVADGKASTEIVNVESEHSAMSAAIGAALAGGRTMTATSSQGLALMAEVVYIAASMRAPIVMALGNRALSGPINIHCDHSDSMLVRDSGVVQLFAENAQEAYDLMVMAPRIAEDPRVLLPVLVCLDGFTITHSAEPVSLLRDGDVARFVGPVPHPERRARHDPTDDAGAVCDARLLLRAAPPAGGSARGCRRRARRGRVRLRAAVRATARRVRGVSTRRCDARNRRARLHGRDGQGRRGRAARRARAGGPPEAGVVPALPCSGRRCRARRMRAGLGARPRGLARRHASTARRSRRFSLRQRRRARRARLRPGRPRPAPVRRPRRLRGAATPYVGLRGERCPV